mmetsp:Transcript_47705/g.126172  ORF Transcript_47705/g.126172 Transcript_47705/m.126172 type:complete len:201 (-) Transcript_47705:932-1534(-)
MATAPTSPIFSQALKFKSSAVNLGAPPSPRPRAAAPASPSSLHDRNFNSRATKIGADLRTSPIAITAVSSATVLCMCTSEHRCTPSPCATTAPARVSADPVSTNGSAAAFMASAASLVTLSRPNRAIAAPTRRLLSARAKPPSWLATISVIIALSCSLDASACSSRVTSAASSRVAGNCACRSICAFGGEILFPKWSTCS